MSKENNLTDFLTDVADAIRAKKGTQALINPQDFSSEIASISGSSTLITKTITQNGTYDATDDNADGYSEVTVNVQGGGNIDGLIDGTISGEITSNATKVRDYAFYNCRTNNYKINLPNATEIGQNAFCSFADNLGSNRLKEILAPEVITIKNYAFAGINYAGGSYGSLEKAIFPKAKTIGDYAFQYQELDNGDIDFRDAETIGQYAFRNAFWKSTQQTQINFICKAQTIGPYAFTNNNCLYSIDCYATNIETRAFYQCYSLKKMTLRANQICTLSSTNNIPATSSNRMTIYVPSDLIESYKTATNWATLYNNGYINFVAIS